ncbi:hypothetical protein SGI37_20430, partial [Providencia rettgeri]
MEALREESLNIVHSNTTSINDVDSGFVESLSFFEEKPTLKQYGYENMCFTAGDMGLGSFSPSAGTNVYVSSDEGRDEGSNT